MEGRKDDQARTKNDLASKDQKRQNMVEKRI